jgi:cysteine synthase A
MARVASDICHLIGRTPLVELSRLSPDGGGRIVAKLEGMNPSGSGKDRIALWMVEEAERSGRLQPGTTIVEPTGGNTGLALALVAAARGHALVLTMPEGASAERLAVLRAFGAEIVLTPAARGMRGAIEEAERIARETADCIVLQQFTNRANPKAHRETTGREIFADLDGRLDVLVAGAGTGGTLTGCAEYLKSRDPSIRIVAVEPAESAVLSGGKPGPHGISGIGPGFIPEVLNLQLIDEIVQVTTAQACAGTRRLARVEAVLGGISSGAVVHAAELVAARPEMQGRTVVAILHDGGERYAGQPVFQEDPA